MKGRTGVFSTFPDAPWPAGCASFSRVTSVPLVCLGGTAQDHIDASCACVCVSEQKLLSGVHWGHQHVCPGYSLKGLSRIAAVYFEWQILSLFTLIFLPSMTLLQDTNTFEAMEIVFTCLFQMRSWVSVSL